MPPFELAGQSVKPGEMRKIHIPAVRLYTDTPIDLIINVIHGKKPGPVLLVCAAFHGDELNGIEICRRLRQQKVLKKLAGTLLIVPVINMLGFIQQSRYLPDRRDLNRCFPGSQHGSLGSRLAYLIQTELLSRATHAIDLHTGAVHRSNLPQIRADFDNAEAQQMAEAFGAPVIMDAKLLAGSFRECASNENVPLIVYEAGEALRFDEPAIKAGMRGILAVMRTLTMLPRLKMQASKKLIEPVQVRKSYWVRAVCDGMVARKIALGTRVKKGELLCVLATPFDNEHHEIRAKNDGIVIGATQIPVVNEGEALLHIAEFSQLRDAATSVSNFQDRFEVDETIGLDQLS
ncbi:MAG: succinylglutamate desuccinylase/aspartoacylase family protein [Pseudomonadales bacterium]